MLDQVPRRQDSPFVFHTPRGVPLKKGNLYYNWNKVRDASGTSLERVAAGIPPIRFHDLRHSCASLLAAQGVPARVVMEILGHSDIRVTQNIYTHVFDDAKRQAADAMDRALGHLG